MSSILASPTKLSGLVSPLAAGHKCRVALVDGELEYPVLPKGAGIDLADLVSAQVEVSCAIQEEDGEKKLLVRSYTVLDSEDTY